MVETQYFLLQVNDYGSRQIFEESMYEHLDWDTNKRDVAHGLVKPNDLILVYFTSKALDYRLTLKMIYKVKSVTKNNVRFNLEQWKNLNGITYHKIQDLIRKKQLGNNFKKGVGGQGYNIVQISKDDFETILKLDRDLETNFTNNDSSSRTSLDDLEKIGVNRTHIQILKQFLILEGQVITDSSKIRGGKGVSMIPPNSIVSEPHYLHNLVRGVYKPIGDDFALSIQTNPNSKWGTEIDFETGKWKITYDFGSVDKYRTDINSLIKCYENNVPIGVIYKQRKGVNQILGLGKIQSVDEAKFIIVPYDLEEKVTIVPKLAHSYAKEQMARNDFSAGGSETTVFVREKQNVFRDMLLQEYDKKCAFCDFGIVEYLTAAHIVPFNIMRKEDEQNAMNPSDGLLLCKLCDIAFESGDIKVTESYGIIPSRMLKEQAHENQSVNSWLSRLKDKIHVKNDSRYAPDKKYLKRKIQLIKEFNV